MLTPMLRCNHPTLNNLCNLFYRHHKKVLNWGDPSIKSLEKKIFIENKNILPISCRILYNSQERGFLTLTWLMLWCAWTIIFFFSFIYFSWFNISFLLIFLFFFSLFYLNNEETCGGRDGIVEETPIHVYYAYLKPTWGYGFNSLVVLCVG